MSASRAPAVSDLERAIKAIALEAVRAELRQLGVGAVPYTFDHLPPGVSRRTFREACAQITGAFKDGRAWVCPRDAWHAARSRPARPRAALRLVGADFDVEELVAGSIARSRGSR